MTTYNYHMIIYNLYARTHPGTQKLHVHIQENEDKSKSYIVSIKGNSLEVDHVVGEVVIVMDRKYAAAVARTRFQS